MTLTIEFKICLALFGNLSQCSIFTKKGLNDVKVIMKRFQFNDSL